MSLTIAAPSVTESMLLDLNNVYEYVITFDEEVRPAKIIHLGASLKHRKVAFLKKSKWNTMKILYLVCRYLPFLFVAVNTSSRIVSEDMRILFFSLSHSLVGASLSVQSPSVMFLVRTYALWDRTRLALAIILVNFMAFLIPIVVLVALFSSTPAIVPVPGITSCGTASQSRILIWSYVLLVIGETGGRSRLLTILVNHNVWYFGCSLTFLPDQYNKLLGSFQTILHAILVTRMHRFLWKSAQKENPRNPADVSLPTIYFGTAQPV
ncbi:hypothetical protein BU15DRAFT_65292 [Melanogaster broomeanus]|nr:hypothetical protein BU15DRAFT_65292 [Melanogaster broomeanus]